MRCAVGDMGVHSVGGTTRMHPPGSAWNRSISLLVIDGPRDHAGISRTFAVLGPCVVPGCYVAFDQYDRPDAPDVRDFVSELVESGNSPPGRVGVMVSSRV